MLDRPTRNAAAALGLALLVLGGCRAIVDADPNPDTLPALAAERPRAPPTTISLELIFVRYDDRDGAFQEELWNLADEQVLDAALRRRMVANGLRAGVVTSRLPPHLAERFLPTAALPGESLAAGVSENPALVRHLLRMLPGRAGDVLAGSGMHELILLAHDGDRVRGTTYRDASALFALRTWPAADGRVRLQVSPTIKHGPVERSWVGEEGMFRLEAGQKREVLEPLQFESTVPVGSMLILTSVGDAASTAGDAFFRDRGTASVRRLLAIRPVPAAVGIDPQFATGSGPSAPDPAPETIPQPRQPPE
jgi:hypothetical protein